MPKQKKKRGESDEGSPPKRPRKKNTQATCMLHDPSLSNHGPLTSLNNVKGTAADKLEYLHDIRDRRLRQTHDSPFRMQSICDQIPAALPDDLDSTGYHRQCYQHFTSNLDRLSDKDCSEPVASTSSCRSPRKRSSGGPIFPPECIFCEKIETKGPDRKTERPQQFSSWRNKENAWEQIESQAEKLGLSRLHRLVKGVNLFSAEAKYHKSCYVSFRTSFSNYERGINRAKEPKHNEMLAAHRKALVSVRDHIQTHVIQQNEVLRLSSLRLVFIEELKKNGYENENYRSEKLLKRLQSDPIPHVSYMKVVTDKSSAISFWLVFNSRISVVDALAQAYTLGNEDKFENAALLLRNNILQAFREAQSLPWPPTSNDMELSCHKLLPVSLIHFLSVVLYGKDENKMNEKANLLVASIGQDVCRAVSGGRWKLPKHVLLCMTVRHLFRSKQLTKILNLLGHSETYNFGLELETALAKAIDEASNFLSPHIVTGEGNEVFHCEWDNLNEITTNVQGNNIVNSAGGIMIQEVKPGTKNPEVRTLPELERTHERSLKVTTPETIPPLHFKRTGPTFPDGSSFDPPAGNDIVYSTKMLEYYVWLFSRYIGSNGKQPVPGLGGFISATGIPPPTKSTVDYFTPIHQPITDNAVVRELLKRSEEATIEVGQKWVLNTFDLGVCMKALPIIWRYPDEFANHVITVGAFHTCMNYIGMLTGHKMKGSGYAEILLESQLVQSGSLKGVLSGKAYAKALFCLKTVSEAMERLLMERFVEEVHIPIDDPAALLEMTQACTREKLDQALKDQSTINLTKKYQAFQHDARLGSLGKTAAFWISVIDHCHLVFMLLYSIKTNNIELFHCCNGMMAPLFFAFDGQNYSRYLVWQEVFLTNIEKTHPGAKDLLRRGGIAVARSMIPGALSAVDKTMEETFMRFAKSSGGFAGLYSQFGAYQRWCRTTSARAQFYEKTLEMVGIITDPDSPLSGRHRELEKAMIEKSETAVQNVITAIRNFTNPFRITDTDRLHSLASGAPVPKNVEEDVLQAEAVGKAAKDQFIERLKSRNPDAFFEPIKRNKLKTMEATNKKVNLTSSQGKVIQYQEQSNLAFLLLVKSQCLDEPIDLDELMKYCLMPVPPSLGTQDGFFSKTNKAAMLHYLLEDIDSDELMYPKDALFIQDGMALLHVLKDLPPTFGDICLAILDQMVAKNHFLFSTDSYHPDSIKAQERQRRGSSEKIILSGPATRKPYDFKTFLSNDENKEGLCQLLLQVWSGDQAASRLEKTKMAVLIVEGRAHQFVSKNGKVEVLEIPSIYSNQEETDSRVVVYLHHAAAVGYQSAVVRTPDTDIFVILLYHCHDIKMTVYLDTGSGKHRQLVNVSELAESFGKEYCATLLGYYVFSGEDCTSAFKGKGKVRPLKKLQKNPKFHKAFQQLGQDWIADPCVQTKIEQFTCMMYGHSRDTSVDVVRAKMLRKMVGENEKLTSKSKVDLARLPPCQSALKQHVNRVNHRMCLYKRANIPILEKPHPYDEGQGWMKNKEGVLEPLWSSAPVLPGSLVDLIGTVEDQDEDDYDFELEHFDFDSGEESDNDV